MRHVRCLVDLWDDTVGDWLNPYAIVAGILALDLVIVLFALYSTDGGRTMATLLLAGILSAVMWPTRFG